MNAHIYDALQQDAEMMSLFRRIASRGTLSVGDLYVSPELDLASMNTALGKLEALGLVTRTGHYYSLSALGSGVARSLDRLTKQAFFV